MTTPSRITWYLRSVDGRIWHDGDPGRLRAWVATLGGPGGVEPRRAGGPTGYPVPREFRHR